VAYDGYLALDGHEIINSERFAAYSSSLVPMLSVRNCYPCSGLPNVINRPTSALTRAQILRASAYRTPLLDRPEWFDPEDPDSWGFVGFYPLSVSGLDDATVTTRVVESAVDGGYVDRPRAGTREIRVSGLLVGVDDRALAIGQRWLSRILRRGSSCEGGSLSYFSACPDCLDPYGIPDKVGTFTAIDASGWTANGGTLTLDGLFTPAAVGGEIWFITPVGSGPSTMTVAFDQPSTPLLRKNLIPNPSCRHPSNGAITLRTNYALNPTGETSLTRWTAMGVSNAANYPIERLANLSGLGAPAGISSAVKMRSTSSADTVNDTALALGSAQTTGVTFDEGWTFTVSAYAMARDIPQFYLEVATYSAGVLFGTPYTSPTVSNTGALQRLSVTGVTIPVFVDSIAVRVVPVDTAGAKWSTTKEIIATGVLAERDVPLRDYFDGSSTGAPTGWSYAWSGATGQSVSTLLAADTDGNLVGDQYNSRGGLLSTGKYQVVTTDAVSGTFAAEYRTSSTSGKRYAASCKVGNLTGDPLDVQLRVYATGGAFTLVSSGSTVTIPTSGETTISASSVAVTPSGTTGITFMLYTMNDVALSSFTIDDTLLEEVATAVGPGPYFDGSFADTPTANYDWEGQPDYSASTIYEPSDPDDYAMVAVEALIDGVVVASTEGSITEGEISVSIDECREGNMTWRVRSIDADPYSVASQTWTFAEEGPVLEASAASWASLEGFSAQLPTDPVGATLDASARPYGRTQRQVTRVSGPTVIEQYASRGAAMVKVEFTLVAGRPYAYSAEVPVGRVDFGDAVDPSAVGFSLPVAIPRCEELIEGSIVDPACEPMPTPPSAPLLSTVCGENSGPVLRRYGIYIPPGMVPSVSDILPILDIHTDTPLSRMNVLFYPAPVQPVDVNDVDPCSLCAAFTINYVGTDGMIVDAVEQSAYTVVEEIVGGVPTGRSSVRNGNTLLTSLDFTPLTWPVLDCSDGYLMVVEVYDIVSDGHIDVKIAVRA
jgi:hypothetical protein